jgi:hypothetical protein
MKSVTELFGMISIQSDLQKINLPTCSYFQTNILQNFIHRFIHHHPSLFCWAHQMIHQHRYIMLLMNESTFHVPSSYPIKVEASFEALNPERVKKLGNWDTQPDSPIFKFAIGKTGADFFRGAIELLHATYIGYHGDAREWLNDNPILTNELLNR